MHMQSWHFPRTLKFSLYISRTLISLYWVLFMGISKVVCVLFNHVLICFTNLKMFQKTFGHRVIKIKDQKFQKPFMFQLEEFLYVTMNIYIVKSYKIAHFYLKQRCVFFHIIYFYHNFLSLISSVIIPTTLPFQLQAFFLSFKKATRQRKKDKQENKPNSPKRRSRRRRGREGGERGKKQDKKLLNQHDGDSSHHC